MEHCGSGKSRRNEEGSSPLLKTVASRRLSLPFLWMFFGMEVLFDLLQRDLPPDVFRVGFEHRVVVGHVVHKVVRHPFEGRWDQLAHAEVSDRRMGRLLAPIV